MRVAWLALPCVLLTGCAFARRENRPVWNVFEQNLVPEDRGWFVASLPLTVPGGLLAILTDTFVAHPIQVVDDAWDDAGWLWRDGRPDFEHRYWSESAFLPVRAAVTPVTFVGAFLGRSMFDTGPDEPAPAPDHDAIAAKTRADFAAWLATLHEPACRPCWVPVPPLDDALRTALVAAPPQASVLGRLYLWRLALRNDEVRAVIDPVEGLRDADPGVRFALLEQFDRLDRVPAELREALRNDPVPSVRALAAKLWPR